MLSCYKYNRSCYCLKFRCYKTKFFRYTAVQREITPTDTVIFKKITTQKVSKPLAKLMKHSLLNKGLVYIEENSTQWKSFVQYEDSDYYNNLFMWTFSTTTVFSLKYNFKQIYFSTYISTQCHPIILSFHV